jgi:hypothetical protein
MVEAVRTSETSVNFYQTTAEDSFRNVDLSGLMIRQSSVKNDTLVA